MLTIVRAVAGERAPYHEYLAERLPDASWCWDRGGAAFDNMVAALEMQGREDAVHLEDDVILTRGFYRKVAEAVAPWRNEVVQMFSCRTADKTRGSRWDAGSGFVMSQCFYVPGSDAAPLAEFYAGWPGRRGSTILYDLAIADYLKAAGRRYRIHVPSLVQHRVGPSLLGHTGFRHRWLSPTFADPWA